MNATSRRSARCVDHLVLPVAQLDCARERLVSLGFTVAPEGRHPFGTTNVCTYIADGTFLEMLAISFREDYEIAIRDSNAFVARDQAYRFRLGEDGFSALVFASDDAKADEQQFIAMGLSGGNLLDFSRAFINSQGQQDVASFRLAFAADLRAPDTFFFTCQRVNVPQVDRSSLERHANGVVALKSVIMSEENPTDFQYSLQEIIAQREANAHSFGMNIQSGNAEIVTLTPEGLKAFFGELPNLHKRGNGERTRGLRLEGVIFQTADMGRLIEILLENNVSYVQRDRRVIIDAADGQGAFFVFEE